MAHDVFISHSSKDKTVADAVCAKLEESGIRCWVAPRDILPGQEYAGAIVNAIQECRVMVVVFSQKSNSSKQVLREVEMAVNKDKTILPFRIEKIVPSGSMEFYLCVPHWLDAMTPPMEAHLKHLAETVKVILRGALDSPVSPAPKPGATGQDMQALGMDLGNGMSMNLVEIPPGRFLMGAPDDDPFSEKDERPQHEARIAKPFRMGVYPVTQEQWRTLMGSEPWKAKKHAPEGPRRPATGVNWHDAVEFCRILSEAAGQTARLPTETEWEYACRAGTTTRYSFGDNASQLDVYAWFDRNTVATGEEGIRDVGQKRPNPWALYDMHGNVWEWCQDEYAPYSVPAGTVPAVLSRSARVLRGGSVGQEARMCRSTARLALAPETRTTSTGFRIAVEFV